MAKKATPKRPSRPKVTSDRTSFAFGANTTKKRRSRKGGGS